jgi:hypothetical protein
MKRDPFFSSKCLANSSISRSRYRTDGDVSSNLNPSDLELGHEFGRRLAHVSVNNHFGHQKQLIRSTRWLYKYERC